MVHGTKAGRGRCFGWKGSRKVEEHGVGGEKQVALYAAVAQSGLGADDTRTRM